MGHEPPGPRAQQVPQTEEILDMSTDKRNERIKLLARNGMLLADIAAKYKLTESRIRQILDPNYNSKASAARRRRKSPSPPPTPSQNGTHPTRRPRFKPQTSDFERQLAYVYGRLESQLEVYAANLGCTFPELAQRVSELLRDKARR